jgi:hypothetical protein
MHLGRGVLCVKPHWFKIPYNLKHVMFDAINHRILCTYKCRAKLHPCYYLKWNNLQHRETPLVQNLMIWTLDILAQKLTSTLSDLCHRSGLWQNQSNQGSVPNHIQQNRVSPLESRDLRLSFCVVMIRCACILLPVFNLHFEYLYLRKCNNRVGGEWRF